MPWLALLYACAPTIPPELAAGPPPTEVVAPEPTDPTARLAWMIGSDPLVRRPRVPAAPDDPALAEWKAVASELTARPSTWWSLETKHPGTLAVPLARGGRLAMVEPKFPEFKGVVEWLVPYSEPTATVEAARPPLDWLAPPRPDDVLLVLERQVLLGWLDGPAIPVGPVAAALASPAYARVSETPAGQLILARAATTGSGDEAVLVEATYLAAMEVAADTDKEQDAWKILRGDSDPINPKLRTQLVDGRSDTAVGRSLVAQAALRWRNGCADLPCGGLDRVRAMRAAERWGVAPIAKVWEVIALKDALDQLLTAYDTPFAKLGVDRVVEALDGVSGLDLSILQHREMGAPIQLMLTRALGGGDQTSKELMFKAINGHLAARAEAALPTAPERLREPLTRIARRAAMER